VAGGTSVVIVADSDEFGGAELVMTSIARRIGADYGYRVTAVLGDGISTEFRTRFSEAGADVRIVRGLRRRCTPLGFVRLVSTLRALRPALFHVSCSDQGSGLAALAGGRLVRCPVVATLHLVSPGRTRWRERVSIWALARADAVIAVSESVAEYLRSRGVPSTVVLNGVDPAPPRDDPRADLGLDPDAFVVGGIGRLDAQKGWDVLCRAAALVRQRIPGARFVVIGRGPEEGRLAGMPECGQVDFIGYRDDAPSYLPAFDALVVPSRFEGFGRVAAESMLAGVPVVASGIGGLPEVVGDCGVLVPPECPEELAEALVRVAEDRERYAELAERGHRRAIERFGVEQMVDDTARVYESVLDSPEVRR
jgi:glycosyltransferase involved in cell wall biosynthesis